MGDDDYDVTLDPRRPRDEIAAELHAAGMAVDYAEANADLCVAYTEGHPDDQTSLMRFQRGESAGTRTA